MSKTIVIVGVTGNQGGSVAQTFGQIPGWSVRGITRNPDKASNQSLKDAGIELVSADLNNKDSLVKAFSGAHAIYGLTDFWQFAKDPSVAEEAKTRGLAVNIVCMEREFEQFKNILHAASHVLQAENQLERLVMSTLSDTKKWSNGQITENLHFDGKAAGTVYLKTSTDPALQALNHRTSWVQIGHYLDNWKSSGSINAPIQQEDGTFIYKTLFYPPYSSPIPYVHPPTDTGPFVKALVLTAPAGTTMLGTSKMLTLPEYTHILSSHFGKPVKIQSVSREQAIQMIGDPFGVEISASAEYVSTIGWDGGDPEVKKPWDLGVDLTSLTTPERYVKQTDWSSVMLKPAASVSSSSL